MLDSGAKHNRTLLSTMSAHSCRIGGSMWKAYLYGEKIGIEREHDGAMNECQRQRLHRHCRQRQGTRERDQQSADDPRVRKAPAKKYLPTLPTHGRGHQSGSVFATIACLQAARAGGICAA